MCSSPQFQTVYENLMSISSGISAVQVCAKECQKFPWVEKLGGIWWTYTKTRDSLQLTHQLLVHIAFDLGFGLSSRCAWKGHQEHKKTLAQTVDWFFWPTISVDIMAQCIQCVSRPMSIVHPKSPFSLPIVGMSGILHRLYGPLPGTLRGYHYALILVNYAMCYPW